MIAVAVNPIPNNFPFSWFDLVLVAVLGFGLFRGRRNGMSRELIPLLKWITLVILSGLGYPTVAQLCMTYLKWGKTISDVTGYVVLALVILFFFTLLNQMFTERLVKNDTFKSAEYYLGMPAGMVRFFCILLAALALINAPVYTQADIDAKTVRDKANFGGGMMSGSFFPSFNDVQAGIFTQSFTGPYIKANLGMLLIDTHRLDVTHLKPPPRTGN